MSKQFIINNQSFEARSPEEFIEEFGAETLIALFLECEARKEGKSFRTIENAVAYHNKLNCIC